MFFRKSRSEKYFKKGVRKISFTDYLGAIDDFSKAINLSPENNRAYFERAKAKKDRNFAFADQIRKDLLGQGIVIEDQQDKTIWKLK